MSRVGLVPHESWNRQEEDCGCRVGTKTELRGQGASARSQARAVMRARVQTKWSNVVSCGLVLVLIGLGSFRPQEGTDRTKSCSLAGLPVFVSRSNCQSASQSASLSVSLSVSVCRTARQDGDQSSVSGRSVGRSVRGGTQERSRD